MEAISNIISASLKPGKKQQFQELLSVEDQVAFIYREGGQFALYHSIRKESSIECRDKYREVSQQNREEGNKFFRSGNYSVAMEYYCSAVLTAPFDKETGEGEDLSLALANRAAALFKMKSFEHCMDEDAFAERSGYPRHMRFKQLLRRAKCLLELSRLDEATSAFQEAAEILGETKLTEGEKKKVSEEIQEGLDATKTKNDQKTFGDSTHVLEEVRVAEPILSYNPQYPSFSDAVTIKYNEQQGRYAVATRDIKVGEVIVLEAPIFHLLHPDRIGANCTFCFKPITIPVPCHSCAAVAYCSVNCRSLSWSAYHKWECSDSSELLSDIYNKVFGGVYRLICQKPAEFYRENREMFSSQNPTWGTSKTSTNSNEIDDSEDDYAGEREKQQPAGSAKERPYLWNDHQNAFNLVTHESRLNSHERLVFVTSASLLLFYLKKNEYFGAYTAGDFNLSDDERLIGRLLFHFLLVTKYNIHCMLQLDSWNPIPEGKPLRSRTGLLPLGEGLYVTLSLLNHSCTPNTARANMGTSCVTVAIKNIRAGEEISDSYKMMYQEDPKPLRQQTLMQSHLFQCRCQACVDSIKKVVLKPGMEAEFKEVKKLHERISKTTEEDIQAGHLDRVIETWCDFYGRIEQVLMPPHEYFLHVLSQLFDSYWLKYGNKIPSLKGPLYRCIISGEEMQNQDANM